MGSTTSNTQDISTEKGNQEKKLENANIKLEELHDVVKKQILIVGSTGTGKSTIINMLYNNDINCDSCKEPAPVGDSSDSVTKALNYYYISKQQISLIDSIGLSDPTITDVEVVLKMKQFLSLSVTGIHLVVIVVKWGRINGPERLNLSAIASMFENNWKEKAVLVLTHYPHEFSEDHKIEDNEIKKWMEKDEQTQKFISGFSKIIVTENAISRQDDARRFEHFRKRLLKELNDGVASSHEAIRISPASWDEIIVAVLFKFFEYFRKPARKIKDIMAALANQKFQTYGGFCPICHKGIELQNLARINCEHSFCFKCIAEWSNQKQICPVCRQTLSVIKTHSVTS